MYRSLFVILLILICTNTGFAQQPPACPQGGPAVSFVFDNDVRGMTLFRGSTNNNTTGLKLSLSLPTHDGGTSDPDRIHRLFPFTGLTGQCHRTTWGLGATTYSPTVLTDPNLISADRPYAGWTYASYAIDAYSPDGKDSEVLEVNIGVIGPMAGGRAIQTWVHENISHAPTARGWAHQIRNTPGAYAFYEQRRRVLQAANDWGDLTVNWGGALGNVLTYPSFGSRIRLGYRVNDIDQSQPVSAYLFMRGAGKLVFRNAFIDGGSFTDESHAIKKRVPVADFELGGAIRFRGVTLTYRTVGRTREFVEQRETHYYGSFGITFGRTFTP